MILSSFSTTQLCHCYILIHHYIYNVTAYLQLDDFHVTRKKKKNYSAPNFPRGYIGLEQLSAQASPKKEHEPCLGA